METNEFSFKDTPIKGLSKLLFSHGFKIGVIGHIDVSNPLPEHPVVYHTEDSNKPYLPVGFVDYNESEIRLVNLDEPFLAPYHEKLRKILRDRIKC